MEPKQSTKGASKTEPKKTTGQAGFPKNPIFKALDELHTKAEEIEMLSHAGQAEMNYPRIEHLFATINRESKEMMNGCREIEFTIKKYLQSMPS